MSYIGIPRLELPPQNSRIYPECTGIWGEFSVPSDCSCETQTRVYTRQCTTEIPCDESYCDTFESNICKVTMPCEAPLCTSSSQLRLITGEFEMSDKNEISQQEFCDILNEFKNLYCSEAIECKLSVGEFSSEYIQC